MVGGGGGGDRKSYSLYKEPIGARSGIESDFGPTMPSREQRGYQKYAAAGDHYYVGYLGQTSVSLNIMSDSIL